MAFYNVPIAFDIETSSTLNEAGEKVGVMYHWQMAIYDYVFTGRTWQEWLFFLDDLAEAFNTSQEQRIIIYVHNLSMEFQFFRHWVNIDSVFAIDERRPAKVVLTNGIEFRCSYLLSNYSLEKVGEHLRKPIKKLIGSLDYDLLRSPITPLTEAEKNYCVNDVLIITEYIQECIEDEGGEIVKIPLTSTGYVRRYCRRSTIGNKENYTNVKYTKLMEKLRLQPNEFLLQNQVFAGGFTHTNYRWSGITAYNVASYDFTSSYPAVLLTYRFPMGRGEKIDRMTGKEFYHNLRNYCCIFILDLWNVTPKIEYENIISFSKCIKCVDYVTNNGRVVSASHIRIAVTEIDYKAYKQFYNWDRMAVSEFYRYEKDYLPTPLVKAILKLYKDKTELKGIEGKEAELMHSKEMLNACYGMMVTNIIRPEYYFENGEWCETPHEPDLNEEIEKYNKSKSRFLFYLWGVFCTSAARYNLYSAIVECGGDDYIYSDTDSVKIVNAEKHKHYFEKYNKWVCDRMDIAMAHHGITDYVPCNIKGEKKPIGVWDYEGIYDRFKALRSKAYMTEKNGKLSITISGVKKKNGVEYIQSLGVDPFELFTDDFVFPEKGTGKQTLIYIDEPRHGTMVDYLGNVYEYFEHSAIHFSGCEYHLNRSAEYLDFLLNRVIKSYRGRM